MSDEVKGSDKAVKKLFHKATVLCHSLRSNLIGRTGRNPILSLSSHAACVRPAEMEGGVPPPSRLNRLSSALSRLQHPLASKSLSPQRPLCWLCWLLLVCQPSPPALPLSSPALSPLRRPSPRLRSVLATARSPHQCFRLGPLTSALISLTHLSSASSAGPLSAVGLPHSSHL